MEAFLKLFQLNPKSVSRIARGERELTEKDVTDLPKGLIPGEWIILSDEVGKKNYIGYCNLYSLSYHKIKIVHVDNSYKYNTKADEQKVALELILQYLEAAVKKRNLYSDYVSGCRLVYGANDHLPGMIVDKYKKNIFIQINTAGIDRFRNEVKSFFEQTFSGMEVVLFDNLEYRKSEVLPVFEVTKFEKKSNDKLEIEENGLKYLIPFESFQKIGYYYDHRENRNKFKNLITRLKVNKNNGLDLFSYVGSWGLHMLSAGIKNVDFIDQANMAAIVDENINLNGFADQGRFIRQDVFKFLDAALLENKRYDIVVSDPPAFAKSEKNKLTAIQGYEKLHTKAMKVLEDQALFAVASCTQCVSFGDLDQTVQDAARKNGQNVQMLDLGIQGFDHPISGLKDKSCYIKYMVYSVNRE